MAPLSRSVVTVIAVLALGVGCQSLTAKTAATSADDTAITATVKTTLVADGPTNLTRVDVDTSRGTVYLNGAVESAEQKARAEQLAWQASGVKKVVNSLQVLPQR
jgi:osmotically-inducible protein OsmY